MSGGLFSKFLRHTTPDDDLSPAWAVALAAEIEACFAATTLAAREGETGAEVVVREIRNLQQRLRRVEAASTVLERSFYGRELLRPVIDAMRREVEGSLSYSAGELADALLNTPKEP